MTFGTEFLVVLEDAARRQKQVYTDSCDFGVIATPKVTETVREACKGLAAIYKSKAKRSDSYPSGGVALWETFIPVETCDYEKDMVNGIHVEVTHVETNSKRYPAYFYIKIEREDRSDKVSFFKPEAA